MGNAATKAKQRWNSNNYTQVKISIDPELASTFKLACTSSGVSMAKKLSQFMTEYSKTIKKNGRSPDYNTKRQRRAAIKSLTGQLKLIKTAEENSRDNIPVNLQETEAFENADNSISLLEEAIDLLESIY